MPKGEKPNGKYCYFRTVMWESETDQSSEMLKTSCKSINTFCVDQGYLVRFQKTLD